MDLSCRLTVVGDIPCLAVSGELDLASIAVLRDALLRVVTSNPGNTVVIDLDGVTVLDDTALGILLGAAARAREGGGDLAIVCTAERLCQRFERTGLDRAVEIRSRVTP